MKQRINWNTSFLVFSLPVLMIISLVLLTQLAIFQQQANILSTAILLDLLLTIPFVYFLLIRKRDVPKITVVSLFVLGIVIASFILPVEQQFWLDKVKMIALPLVELGVLSFVGIQTYKTIHRFKAQRNNTADFYTAVRMACKEVLPPRVSTIAATEITMVYYTFFAWKKRTLAANEFSYHKKSGVIALFMAFLFIILVETVVLHILVQQWSVIAAWILSALSVYTCLQVFALSRSILKRAIVIDSEKGELLLRFGFFGETTIPLNMIEHIEINSSPLPKNKSILPLSPLTDLTPHNVFIKVKKELPLQQLYGFNKTYKGIAFYVDEKEDFVKRMQAVI